MNNGSRDSSGFNIRATPVQLAAFLLTDNPHAGS